MATYMRHFFFCPMCFGVFVILTCYCFSDCVVFSSTAYHCLWSCICPFFCCFAWWCPKRRPIPNKLQALLISPSVLLHLSLPVLLSNLPIILASCCFTGFFVIAWCFNIWSFWGLLVAFCFRSFSCSWSDLWPYILEFGTSLHKGGQYDVRHTTSCLAGKCRKNRFDVGPGKPFKLSP